MCEFSEKLVAWLDRELPSEEASALERHLHSCSECSGLIAAYEEVSTALSDYCYCVMAPARRTGQRVMAGTGAVAAGLLLLSLFPRVAQGPAPLPPPPGIIPPAIAFEQAPVQGRNVPQKRTGKSAGGAVFQPVARGAVERAGVQNAVRPFPEIEIAIPAEAIFPPGAAPEGVQFVAAISIGADGSAQSIRLRPY